MFARQTSVAADPGSNPATLSMSLDDIKALHAKVLEYCGIMLIKTNKKLYILNIRTKVTNFEGKIMSKFSEKFVKFK